ncbi:MAG TPA: TIGR02206 family membrane protein [Prosthecobacter sp.]|nr:TIGR02206 family membrane protein [Prosthecobacter sp.]HRK16412.1 TIGR02206 family membrane protein [Prosthecobacter sp.]
MPPYDFQAFSRSHIAVLAACLAALVLLAFLRRVNESQAVRAERVLGFLLLLIWPLTVLAYWHTGILSLGNALPLHYCDIAGIAAGLALLTRRQTACEVVYYLGLAGTLQGLLTPNLKADFPDPRFLVFFLLHGGVVVTALHVVTSMGRAPRPGALRRMLAFTLGYAALTGLINTALGTNYAFLCRKPEQASLMDHLGPWPWYIGSLVLLAFVLYSLLHLPFHLARRKAAPDGDAAA